MATPCAGDLIYVYNGSYTENVVHNASMVPGKASLPRVLIAMLCMSVVIDAAWRCEWCEY